ncbi:hypothetical protein E1293_22950 [Actinomadura darangshiensis]|uniref:DUF2568 domain-containing protein n=1 Tax=Actinomadura darangshiensis TaxID=705336 RepID=A0A4V6PES6_9ACTN|nr:hypothetical protein [Actinomadura darangshiensis]TDD79607.1 hypothetical protein E1293_22950 [Actinomadura darangshiensis]
MAVARSVLLPSSLRGARVLMFVVAGLSVVWSLAFLVGYGWTAENFGAVLLQLIPGGLSLFLALRLATGRRRVRTGVVALEIVWMLIALGRLGQGDATGVLGLLIPAVILILVTRRTARDHFASKGSGYF